MMTLNPEVVHSWHGTYLQVEVLYSRAGVGQHIWISNEHGALLIDAGDGVLRDLLAGDFDTRFIQGIVFTHGHFDHMGGMYTLLGFLRMIGRAGSLQICAPEGCNEVFSMIDNFLEQYTDTIPYHIVQHENQPGEELRIAQMTVKPYPVIHCGSISGLGMTDQIPALGYRISYRDETIAVTGDTGMCRSLRDLVTGADLAIVEATYRSSDGVDQESLERVHLSEELATEIGRLAKEYVLVHRGQEG